MNCRLGSAYCVSMSASKCWSVDLVVVTTMWAGKKAALQVQQIDVGGLENTSKIQRKISDFLPLFSAS